MNLMLRRISMLSLLLASIAVFGADVVQKTWTLTPVGGRVYSDNAAGTPTAPTAGSATVNSISAVTVSVSAPCICDTLTPQYKTSASGTWLSRSAISTGATSYQHTGLSASTEYDFRFVAGANSQTANSNTVSATTDAGDSTPNAFTFTDQTDVALSSTRTSAAITVSGINVPSAISVTGGTYDVNSSGSFTSSGGNVNNGDTVRARHTSSASNSTATNTVVTIGGVSDTFTSTTLAGGGGGDGIVIDTGDGTITITQSGGGLGTRARAEPLLWDNFAGTSNGGAVNGRTPPILNTNVSTTWTADGQTLPTFSNANQRISGKNTTRHPFGGATYNSSATIRHAFSDSGVSAVRTAFWYYLTDATTGGGDGEWPRNVKPVIFYGNASLMPEFYLGWGDVDGSDGSLRNSWQDNRGGGNVNVTAGGSSQTNFTGAAAINVINAKWIKIEVIAAQGTAGNNGNESGGTDGYYYLAINDPVAGTTYRDFTASVRTRDTTNYWRTFDFGTYYDQGDGTVYIDEVILDDDDDHRRIVVCETDTYLNCEQPEDQPGQSWSDTAVVCIFNQGQFTTGQTVYVFLVTGAGGYQSFGAATLLGSVEVP